MSESAAVVRTFLLAGPTLPDTLAALRSLPRAHLEGARLVAVEETELIMQAKREDLDLGTKE